jgi:hypothetical protein
VYDDLNILGVTRNNGSNSCREHNICLFKSWLSDASEDILESASTKEILSVNTLLKPEKLQTLFGDRVPDKSSPQLSHLHDLLPEKSVVGKIVRDNL